MVPLTTNGDVATRLLDKTVNHRQTQSGAWAYFLGGKEGFEGVRLNFFRHSAARVLSRQFNVVSDFNIDSAASARMPLQFVYLRTRLLIRHRFALHPWL